MLIESFPAGPWETNCYVIAPAAGSDAIVVDPGFGAASPLRDVLREYRLRAVAVVLTHGHMDHVWSVVPVCDEYAVPAYIHPGDRERLTNPSDFMSAAMRAAILDSTGGELTTAEPEDVRVLADGTAITIAGIELVPMHTPGHTPGSTVFHAGVAGEAREHLVSGDVLFNNGIGRTDLVGGDPGAMAESLVRLMSAYDDSTLVYPGHGPVTTIGDERRRSRYLREALAEKYPRADIEPLLAGAGSGKAGR
ncbi:MAG: MBL fold metallo-hydrolase [Actinomycetales bacterium]|nr:MBL fold metallo-hydrolase [Actinomycetales bacterium]